MLCAKLTILSKKRKTIPVCPITVASLNIAWQLEESCNEIQSFVEQQLKRRKASCWICTGDRLSERRFGNGVGGERGESVTPINAHPVLDSNTAETSGRTRTGRRHERDT